MMKVAVPREEGVNGSQDFVGHDRAAAAVVVVVVVETIGVFTALQAFLFDLKRQHHLAKRHWGAKVRTQ